MLKNEASRWSIRLRHVPSDTLQRTFNVTPVKHAWIHETKNVRSFWSLAIITEQSLLQEKQSGTRRTYAWLHWSFSRGTVLRGAGRRGRCTGRPRSRRGGRAAAEPALCAAGPARPPARGLLMEPERSSAGQDRHRKAAPVALLAHTVCSSLCGLVVSVAKWPTILPRRVLSPSQDSGTQAEAGCG